WAGDALATRAPPLSPSRRTPRIAESPVPRAESCGQSLVGDCLVEWRLHDRRGRAFSANVDLELGALFRASDRHIGRADRDAQRGAHRAALHVAARFAIEV